MLEGTRPTGHVTASQQVKTGVELLFFSQVQLNLDGFFRLGGDLLRRFDVTLWKSDSKTGFTHFKYVDLN